MVLQTLKALDVKDDLGSTIVKMHVDFQCHDGRTTFIFLLSIIALYQRTRLRAIRHSIFR